MAIDTTTTNFTEHDFTPIENKAHYRGASFAYHRCAGANFRGLDLTGCNFTGADCTGAIFDGAILDKADFTAATVTRMQLNEAASTSGTIYEDAPVPIDAQIRIKELEIEVERLKALQKEAAEAALLATKTGQPVVLEEKSRKR